MLGAFAKTFGASKKPTAARCFATGALAAAVVAGSPAHGAEPLDEAALTRRVCETGPVSAVARAQRQLGSAVVTAAGVLPNPSVVAEHQRSVRGATERETIVGVSAPLHLGGRRGLLRSAAASRGDQARAEAHVTLFDAALAFREAYAKAAIEQARVDVLGEQQRTLDDLAAVIRALSQGGEAAGYDLLRQQTQARLHGSVLGAARVRAQALRARLTAWMDGEIFVRPPESPSVAHRGTAAFDGETARVRALQASSRAAAFDARAARRRWIPELDVFLGYRQVTSGQETGHGVSVGLTIPLALFDHGQGESARADAEQQVALAGMEKLRREQLAEARASRIKLEGLAVSLAQVEQAVAQAMELQNQARRLYAAGESTITEVLEALRAVEEARLVRVGLLEEVAETRLALMRAAGTMFDPSLDRACGEAAKGAR